MKNDIYKTFGDIYDDNPASLTHDIIKIAKHTVSQESMLAWANNLRFLTAGPPSHSSNSLAGEASNAIPCACEKWPAFEAGHEYTNLHLTLPLMVSSELVHTTLQSHTAGSTQVIPQKLKTGLTRYLQPGESDPDERQEML